MTTLSPIQDSIISRLKNADYLRYRDMRPSDQIPNDLYNYHLRSLVSRGLIQKSPEGYTLSPDGIRYVADMQNINDHYRRLFKMNVILIVARTVHGKREILNQYRTSQPSYGKCGVPGGTITKGEPLLEAASRKLSEETGLSADFQLLGHERRMQYKDSELFSDILFPICFADTWTGELRDTKFGKHQWVSLDQAIENEGDPHDSIEGIRTVLTTLKNEGLASMPLFYSETSQHTK